MTTATVASTPTAAITANAATLCPLAPVSAPRAAVTRR
jgi:hypothetical protein